MKIKKILVTFSLIILTILLSSCTTITDDAEVFVEKLYSQQIGKINGLVVDLRVRGTEAEEPGTFSQRHISGAKSFDVSQDEDFKTWIGKLASKKITIFIVDSGKEEYKEIVEILKEEGYKNIVVYTKGYDTLRLSQVFIDAIYEGSGIDDCGCD